MVGGTLQQGNDSAVIERLRNPFLDACSTTDIKMLIGIDPKKSFEDDVATVRLGKG